LMVSGQTSTMGILIQSPKCSPRSRGGSEKSLSVA
jgi:hypothetical protein